MYRVLIFSDSRYRDSFGTALLKWHLNQWDDIHVEFASYNYWEGALELFNPHAVIINHIQGVRSNTIASRVKRNGGLVFVQFNEGVIEFDNKRKIFEQQANHELVDRFFCWNKETAEIVGGLAVGHQRFDIYGKYRKLIDSPHLFRRKHQIDTSENFILFGSSFPSAKFNYSLQGFHRQNWKDLGNTDATEWKDADDFATQQRFFQKHFMALAIGTSLGINKKTVVKPHPMSDIQEWQEFGRYWDIPIVASDYIFNALASASVFVTKLGSISVAEAWMMGVPVVASRYGYDSASSEEQEPYVELTEDGNEISFSIDKKPKDGWEAYTTKWGINPMEAGVDISGIINDDIKKAKPKLVEVEESLLKFRTLVEEHDSHHLGYRVDAYGNHNKAVRDIDISEWEDRIDAI